MLTLNIQLNGDGILKDFPYDRIVHIVAPLTVATLAGGMENGATSVALIFDLPDGRKVLAETSALLFVTAARAIEARFGPLL
jgi:uncharacterized protein (UPF0371 family)